MKNLQRATINYATEDGMNKYTSRHVIVITLRITDDNLKLKDEPIDFKVDTGASTTVLPAEQLGIHMTEMEYVKQYNAVGKPYFGVVKTKEARLMCYDHIVEELHIEGIVLRQIPISITFDDRVTSILLGMSILGLFDINISSTFKTITFTETEELAEYTRNKKPIDTPLILCRQQYVDFSVEDIQANYINHLIKNNDK